MFSAEAALKVETTCFCFYFFKCGFNKRIWKEILSTCLVDELHVDWDDNMSWGLWKWRGRTVKTILSKLISWGAAVYSIWKQRNDIKHGNQIMSEEKIVIRIKWEVRSQDIAYGMFKFVADGVSLRKFSAYRIVGLVCLICI